MLPGRENELMEMEADKNGMNRNVQLGRWRCFRGPAWSVCLVGLYLAQGPSLAQQLSLHQAVEQALNSPQAQVAKQGVAEARGTLRQAGLGLNPRLFLQSEDFRPWADDYDFTTQTEDYGFLSQTFETDGKRHKREAAARANLERAKATEELRRNQIAGRVAAAYWNAAVLQRIAVLLKGDMSAVDSIEQYDRERVDAGAMRGVDLLRTQIERDRLGIALRVAERDAAGGRLELFQAMGTPPLPHVELTDSLEHVTAVPPVALEAVLAVRPDVVAARGALRVAEADARLQRAVGVPNLDLVGGYKRNGTVNTGYAALQIDLPFRNRNQGEIERAEAGVALSRANLAALEVQVRAEVALSEENYRSQQDIIQDLLPDMRQKATENLRLITEAYRIGGVDLLRFLDAERTEFEVEVNALRAQAELQQAALRLLLSYGGQP